MSLRRADQTRLMHQSDITVLSNAWLLTSAALCPTPPDAAVHCQSAVRVPMTKNTSQQLSQFMKLVFMT